VRLITLIEARARAVEGPGNVEHIYLLASRGASEQVLHSDQRFSYIEDE
jgi:hypothetical protein